MMSLRRNVKLEAEHGKALIASTSDVLFMPYDDQIHPLTHSGHFKWQLRGKLD